MVFSRGKPTHPRVPDLPGGQAHATPPWIHELLFPFQDGTKELGAVQVINESTVWMDPTAEAELGEPLALASAALLLQQGLLKKIDDKEKK